MKAMKRRISCQFENQTSHIPSSLESSSRCITISEAAESSDNRAGHHDLNHKKCRVDQMQVKELSNQVVWWYDGGCQSISQSPQFSLSICKPSPTQQEKHKSRKEQSSNR
ncbi:hypothetical protein Ancab_006899 [Ancistrocladus abbreviatus]